MTVVAQLARRASELQRERGGRVLVGIAGQPGSGKSTVAAEVAAVIGEHACVVPMDGYHMRNDELLALGRRDRKGAPDTFDVGAFATLLRRLRSETGAVPFPEFDRDVDEPLPDARTVPGIVDIVIVEGNYLLTTDHGWDQVLGLFDEIWYIDLDQTERMRRLVKRHQQFGMTYDEAVAWANGPDQTNAVVIAGTRESAHLVVVTENYSPRQIR